MKTLTVGDVMTADVVTARPAMPLKEAARVLHERRISAMPVLDEDDQLVGIVSERDLLLTQAAQLPRDTHWWESPVRRDTLRRSAGDTVGHVMTTKVVTTLADVPLARAARSMTSHAVKRLPVLDGDGRHLVGVVSRTDLLRAFLRSDDDIRADVLGEVLVHLLWQDPTAVEVDVVDGVVSLSGELGERSTAEAAERLVRRLDGVVDVVSHLTWRVDDGGLTRRR
ncbi:CBS domain-containing protein [Pseudonocardia sp. RS11V-5]|uniref:CBS domain-containing protein n=1 Tax=Pseudonocardia terrae TaxID=2905831 RepID=UPI001E4DCAEA|nr:CBS domain-containing protein [Pseudonocardia terrae]MCE3553134.1 CBS domain-containing protein [Pseudonocardia terrae]